MTNEPVDREALIAEVAVDHMPDEPTRECIEGTGWVYARRCGCGWLGEDWPTHVAAEVAKALAADLPPRCTDTDCPRVGRTCLYPGDGCPANDPLPAATDGEGARCEDDHSVWRQDIADLEADVEMWKKIATARTAPAPIEDQDKCQECGSPLTYDGSDL